MKAIVTGAAGFIGSHLVDRLLADGAEVIGVDNFDPFYARPAKEANLASALRNPRCRPVEVDIRDAAGVEALVGRARPDASFRETDPVDHPISSYAATRKACELLAYTLHHLHGLPVAAELGYAPRTPIAEGLARYVAWYRSTAS